VQGLPVKDVILMEVVKFPSSCHQILMSGQPHIDGALEPPARTTWSNWQIDGAHQTVSKY
jgi:hypothetical protein